MTRLKDWQARLIAYLATASRRPFAAGEHDCALFTAGAVAAMTGDDPAAKWRGKYKTIKAGVASLRRKGHADHVDLVASLFEEVAPPFAHVGDIGVVEGALGFGALGIVQGEGVYVLTEQGMAIVSRMRMLRAFRV